MEKTATDQTTTRSLKTKPNTIQPPPLLGIYEVPGSGSLFAREPKKVIRQALTLAGIALASRNRAADQVKEKWPEKYA